MSPLYLSASPPPFANLDIESLEVSGSTPAQELTSKLPISLRIATVCSRGTLKLSWNEVFTAKGYSIEYAPYDNGKVLWKSLGNTFGTNVLLRGFASSRDYWFRISAIV